MATDDQVINPGTEITFQSSGGTVLMTVDSGVSFTDGRKSAECTLATNYTDDRPERYRWTCKAFWGAGAALKETLDLFLAQANADGEYEGGVTAGDAEFLDVNGLSNMTYVGSVVVTNATEELEHASGEVILTSNKCVLVVWNTSAAAAMHATATNFEFKLLPIPKAPEA